MAGEKNKKTAADYSAVIVFVISYFFLKLFDLEEATNFVLASFFSLLAFMIDVHYLKEEKHITKENLRLINFQTGLLTVYYIIIIAVAIINWTRLLSTSWRMGLLLVSMVLFMAFIFKAINILKEISIKSEKKK